MFGRQLVAALILLGTGWGSSPAAAQEDLNRGKTPAQLFASDCADCHRNPRGLKRDPGSLAGFLRVHYTASRESAAAIAAYLISLGPDPRGSRPAATPRRQGQTAQPASKPSETAAPKPAEPVPEAAPAAVPPAAVPPSEPPAPATPPAAPANPQ